MINIKGLNKAEVLKALYDHSHVQGMGIYQTVPEGTVTVEHCQMLLDTTGYPYFDYLYGRVIKVDLSGDEFDERLYDRDCCPGAAERAVRRIRNRYCASNLGIVIGDGIDAMITDHMFYDARELRIRFKSVLDIDKMICVLEQHKRRVERGECIG